jgi:undecaprenyl-diphosphatase
VISYPAALVQGIVEGLTEFLPVSSTGHLILAGKLLKTGGEAAKTFEVFIQLGAILAVAVLYRSRILQMLRRWREVRPGSGALSLGHIFVAMLPALFVGALGHHLIKTYLFAPRYALIGLVVGGIFLILCERLRKPETAPDLDRVTYRQAFGIGCFQCLALWPGFSRAGATIGGGLLLGAGRRAAADFSFLLAIPMMVAASAFDLYKSMGQLSGADIGPFAVGFVAAFLVAWLAVAYFLKLVGRITLTPFALYRFALAAVYALAFLR